MKRKMLAFLAIALVLAGTYSVLPKAEKLAYEVGPPMLVSK